MQDTRDRIIELADQLIKTRGFNAFSYKDISDPLEIKNAAIHYYFPAKTDLGIAVIQHEIEKLAISKVIWATLPENIQLQHLFDTFGQKGKNGCICLMGSLSPDFETLQIPMQEKLREMSTDMLEWLTTCLENGRTNQLFHFQGIAYDRALLVISSLLASLLLSRVMGQEIYEKMSRQLLKDLL